MTNRRPFEFEGSEDIVGLTISRIRTSRDESGAVRRVVLMFDDGSSLEIDGNFPANARLEAPADQLETLESATISSVEAFLTEEPGGGRSEEIYRQTLSFILRLDTFDLAMMWTCVGHSDFDVSPDPKIAFRPPFAPARGFTR